MRGPRPRNIRNPVVDPMTALSLVLRSFAMMGIPGLNMADASGLRTAMVAMTAMFAYLRLFGQFLGFSGSSSAKSINYCGGG